MALPIIQKKAAVQPQAAVSPQQKAQAQTAAQGAQAVSGLPLIGAFSIKVKMKKGVAVKDVSSALRSVSFMEVAQEKDAVSGLYVESRDIRKQPYIFSILKATDEQLELSYTIPPRVAPGRRKLDMVRYFINMLTMLEPFYEIDDKIVLQLMESSIKDVVDSVSMDYSKLYTSYDTLKKEVDDLKRKTKRLSEENSTLANGNYELKGRNDELLLRLKQLENIPEDALRAKLQEWIIEHNGEINISEFCRLNGLNEVYVEEVLNKLMMEGYIESVE